MDLPRITLVTPSFNQAKFLDQTIRSILEQRYPNMQYGIVDGGSTDGSIDVIYRHRSRLNFVIIEPDRGQSDAINKGFALADGEILGWVNSDDTLLPGSLEVIGRHFAEHLEDDWVIGYCREIDEAGRPGELLKPVGDFTLAGALMRRKQFVVPQPSVFWRKKLTDQVGFLDCKLHHCMDFDLWCRFLAAGARPTLIENELSTYRLHAQSKTCSQAELFIAALIQIERRYMSQLPFTQKLALSRMIGYQSRALALRTGELSPWKLVLRRPWWVASQQMRQALFGVTP